MKVNLFSKRLLALASAAVLFVSAAMPSSAQTAATGSISGAVTDKSGAIVPGATVEITDTDTGATRTVTTNSDGSYVVPFLQSGHYEVVLGGGTLWQDRPQEPGSYGRRDAHHRRDLHEVVKYCR